MKRLIISLALTGVTITGCANESQFRLDCQQAGGFVAQTGESFFTQRIDCIKDNQVIYLPGYA